MKKETNWLQKKIEEIEKEFGEKFKHTETCDLQRFETSEIERERLDCFCQLKDIKSFLSQKLHSLVEEALQNQWFQIVGGEYRCPRCGKSSIMHEQYH